MSDQPLHLSLPPIIQDRLASFQHKHQFDSLNDAVISILRDFFAIEDAESHPLSLRPSALDPTVTIPTSNSIADQQPAPLGTSSSSNELENLEQKLEILTRQLVQIQQQLPEQYDQLRGQVAAIHLSHSGLIRNLRERVEVLENGRSESAVSEEDLSDSL